VGSDVCHWHNRDMECLNQLVRNTLESGHRGGLLVSAYQHGVSR